MPDGRDISTYYYYCLMTIVVSELPLGNIRNKAHRVGKMNSRRNEKKFKPNNNSKTSGTKNYRTSLEHYEHVTYHYRIKRCHLVKSLHYLTE